jgi:DNA repair exonuclease SbcCD nuclease subunit
MGRPIKKLIHTADWHLKPYNEDKNKTDNHYKFLSAIDGMLESVDSQVSHLHPDEVRFVIVGDLFDHKEKEPSNISMQMMAKVLKRISDKYKTIVVIGNHDYDIRNRTTLDCISPIMTMFELHDNKNISFYKHSQCFVDENILFCNYSHYDFNKRPEIEKYIAKYPDKKPVGLFHHIAIGSLNETGEDISAHEHEIPAVPLEEFIPCKFVLAGDIHKHQVLPYQGGKLVYSGSLFQIGYGERVSGHGYCLWDVESETFEFNEVETDYGLYKVVVNSIDDVIGSKLHFTNL